MLGEKHVDRIELVSVLPHNHDSSLAFTGANFYSATASESLVRPVSEVPHNFSYGTYYVVGINQQTGRSYMEEWDGSSVLSEFGSTWQEGYYRIHIRYYDKMGSSNPSKSGSFINLEKYPLYWNRSPLAWMTYIQPGVFWEGSPADEYGRDSAEVLRRVTLTKGFYLSRTVATAGLYSTVVSGTPSTSASPRNQICYSMFDDEGKFWKQVGSNNTWTPFYTDDTDYAGLSKPSYFCIKSRGRKSASGSWGEYTAGLVDSLAANPTDYGVSGYVWGLPTEAQWEYACRAGTKTALNNGQNLSLPTGNESSIGGSNSVVQPNLEEIAWYNLNSKTSASGSATYHSVAQKKPNAWGFYDMLGNVYEWCSNYEGTRTSDPVSDPTTNSSVSVRALRGGNCYYYARYCRSAYRYFSYVSNNNGYFGCRLALLPSS